MLSRARRGGHAKRDIKSSLQRNVVYHVQSVFVRKKKMQHVVVSLRISVSADSLCWLTDLRPCDVYAMQASEQRGGCGNQSGVNRGEAEQINDRRDATCNILRNRRPALGYRPSSLFTSISIIWRIRPSTMARLLVKGSPNLCSH